MNYLLDTNVCIAIINNRPLQVRTCLEHATASGAVVYISSVVAYELWYGAAKSARPEFNRQRLAAFFSGPFDVVDFDGDDAQTAGRIRATLEAGGTPIGAYDLLIGGQALQRGLTLVTANFGAFSQIARLAWEDWATTP